MHQDVLGASSSLREMVELGGLQQRTKAPGAQELEHESAACPGADGRVGCIRKNIASRLREVVIPLRLELVRPQVRYGMQCWAAQYKINVDKVDWVQRRVAMVVGGWST